MRSQTQNELNISIPRVASNRKLKNRKVLFGVNVNKINHRVVLINPFSIFFSCFEFSYNFREAKL